MRQYTIWLNHPKEVASHGPTIEACLTWSTDKNSDYRTQYGRLWAHDAHVALLQFIRKVCIYDGMKGIH